MNTCILKKNVLEQTAVTLLRSDVKVEVAGLAENMHSVKTGEAPCFILSVFTFHAGPCFSQEELVRISYVYWTVHHLDS